jgi:hypothetical protein
MATDDNVLSALIHADSKAGKSTLTSTAPPPILVCDAEGSWKYINQAGFKSGVPLRKVKWDPLKEACPQWDGSRDGSWDGSWDVVTAKCTSWEHLTMIYQHLTQRPHQFQTVVLDSITEVQRKCKANLKGTEAMQIQDWGVLLVRMDDLIRKYRDLILIDPNVRCVLFVAETKMINGKWRPKMQGQIAGDMPYWVDIVGYLKTMMTADPATGLETVVNKVLHIGPSDFWESGERLQGLLPDAILHPNITSIMKVIESA